MRPSILIGAMVPTVAIITWLIKYLKSKRPERAKPEESTNDMFDADSSVDSIFDYAASSDSTFHPNTVQIELNNILAQLQVDPDYDQLSVSHLQRWTTDKRLILCPSKQLNRIGDIKFFEKTDDTMNGTIWSWSNQFQNYAYDGTLVIPAVNLRMLLNKMTAEAISSIIGQAMYKTSCEQGISYTFYKTGVHYEHKIRRNDCEVCDSIIQMTTIFDKLIFALTFYREYISFQLFRNTNRHELDQHFNKLFDELDVRFADENMETCHTSTITRYWCLCNCTKLSNEYWIAMAQQAARSMKNTLKHLGAKISLPFEPKECDCAHHIGLVEPAGLENYPVNRITAEIFLGQNYQDSAQYLNGQIH